MRIAYSLALGVMMVKVLACRADDPTAEEQKTVAAVMKLSGSATIDSGLHPGARVSVKFNAVTDATLIALSKHPNIGAIQAIESTACNAKGYAALKSLPHLRRLVLNKSGVSDKGLAEIGGCKQLRMLVIPESAATDKGLAAVAKLTRLDHLDLSDAPKVTDKGMVYVKALERLEVLYLNKTGISDKGLAELKTLEGLRSLNVAGTKVSATAAEKFPDEMPNLRTVRR